jgi:transcriptional regulator with GAF, ATPase, and Fis domain
VNCAALATELIESELFGRVKGAYTSAYMNQAGRFEVADKGTLFLDEIGELSLSMQSKLLRVLQDGEFERLGSSVTIKVDVRVIVATSRNIEDLVRTGKFRQDLYYRLNVFPIRIPPLRERAEDIPLLADYFVKKYARKLGKNIDRIPKRTLNKMMSYVWPGNIRELEHFIERGVIISTERYLRDNSEQLTPLDVTIDTHPIKDMAAAEQDHILRALNLADWKIEGPNGAAQILDMHPSTLRYRLNKWGIRRPS